MTIKAFDDPELFKLLDQELERQNSTLQLIASENLVSPSVVKAMGTVLTNKYSEGYPGKRYYGGNEIIDEVEDLVAKSDYRNGIEFTMRRGGLDGRERTVTVRPVLR